jgi:dihydrofolate reductase
MRRLCYHVAASLDGYIARPGGEYDWIVQDSEIDFKAIFAKYDIAVMGRKTFEVALSQGGDGSMPGMDVVVFSRTLKPADYPAVSIVGTDPAEHVRALKKRPSTASKGGKSSKAGRSSKAAKDIWLFGGGELFRMLLNAGVVDRVDIAVIPVLLGDGIPMLPSPATFTKLSLTHHRLYPKSGIVILEYAVKRSRQRKI